MKKRCAWLLMLTLLFSTILSNLAYATGEEGDPAETEISEEAESAEAPEGEAAPESLPEDPRAMLSEAMEKSQLEADEVIAEGVFIDTVNVSKMTAEEALEAVLARVDELGKKTLTLTLADAEGVAPIQVPFSELGLRTKGVAETVMEAIGLGKSGNLIVRYKAQKDLEKSNQTFEIPMEFDETAMKSFLTEKTAELGIEPVDAELTRTGDGFSVSQSQDGIQVDVDATAAAIQAVLADWNQEDVSVAAVAQVKAPKYTTEMLSQIQDKIGTFSTKTSSNSGSKMQNLKVGVSHTTDILIMPGETWSMHSALSPFNAENGYTEEIAYQNGGYVREYGGGICQLATTLYNAALLSEIHVSERHNHSMTVGYTYWGLDATINDGGSKDLKLTNDFDFPVYIEASVNSSYVTYSIWGKETRPANRELKFYGVTLKEEYPGTEIIEDPTKPVGYEEVVQNSQYPEAIAEGWKEIWVDGVLQEKIRLHTDKYRASTRKVIRGTAPVTPETPPAVTPTDPTQPIQPTDPAPTDPTQPTQPTQPTDPVQPTDPTQPPIEAPTAPSAPAGAASEGEAAA